jgi:hypothetical protein
VSLGDEASCSGGIGVSRYSTIRYAIPQCESCGDAIIRGSHCPARSWPGRISGPRGHRFYCRITDSEVALIGKAVTFRNGIKL